MASAVTIQLFSFGSDPCEIVFSVEHIQSSELISLNPS